MARDLHRTNGSGANVVIQFGDESVLREGRRVRCSIEIDAEIARVFDHWSRFESLPRWMDGVRRTKQIGDRRVLWDVDVSGRQVVWEAEILECVPGKRIRWESRWGAPNAGEVSFEALPDRRTRLTVDLRFRPRDWLERIGARLDLVGSRIRRDLDQFRRCVESPRSDAARARTRMR